MKLHSNILTEASVYLALYEAKKRGKVADSVHFVVFKEQGSRSRKTGFEIQLGTYDKVPGDKRTWKNSGQWGAESARNGQGIYAATYDEWGWFIAELFAKDEDAIFGSYKGYDDFLRQTKFAYDI